MHISHDYTNLLEEFQSDLLEGLIKPLDTIKVGREPREPYQPIVDYFCSNSVFTEKEIEGLIIENMLVGEALAEMIARNPIIRTELTTAEVAEKYGKTPNSVKQNCARGVIKCRKVAKTWLIDEQSAEQFYCSNKRA